MTHNGKTTAKTRRVSLSSVSVQSSDDSSSSLSDLSDDNGYSDLDNISDDEADEDDEEVSAMEMAYIQDEIPVTPSKSVTDHQSVADDADAEDGDNSTIASNLFWDQDIDVEEDTTATPHRQVRFDIPDSPSSSSATEDDDDGMFPDIFVPRSQLDPSFRREVDRDPDMWSNGSADLYDNLPYDSQTEDYYTDLQDGDINDMMTEAAFADFDMSAAVNSGTFDFDDDDGSSPGGIEISCGGDDILYLGDSTDDDEDPEPTPRKSRASPSPEDEETDLEIVEHNGVRLGSFRVQPTGRKPIVFRDPRTGEKVIKYPHELSMDQSAQTSMLGSPANLMLSGALPSMDMGGVALGQALFPLAALFPMNFGDMNDSDLSSPIEGSMGLDENGTDGGTEAHETMLNEFVNLEDEGAKEESGAANTDCEPSTTPMRPVTASSDFEPLSHLGSHNVAAFRRDQHNRQLILSNQATQDSLALAQPYNTMCIKGIRSDRFDSVGVPLTPARRHKKTPSDFTRSPLDAVSTTKRKMSADQSSPAHKRYRSISDVSNMNL